MSERINSPYEEAQTPEEISRRKFMANATIGVGAVIGLGLAIPIVGSLIPDVGSGGARFTPLDQTGWKELQTATDKAVHIQINLKSKDAYLPEENSPQTVWGIKVSNPQKFMQDRTDLFKDGGKVPYQVVTMGFVMFSPMCPHLGCYYNWDSASNKFMCPCHGSQFDNYGAHIAGPAARGLDPLPFKATNGAAEVEWIRYAPTVPERLVVSYTS